MSQDSAQYFQMEALIFFLMVGGIKKKGRKNTEKSVLSTKLTNHPDKTNAYDLE